MTDKKLSTDSYKGVRDFYPEDMAIQRYIFETWAKTAESFGFERYDASILEPSDLYKAKGAENEEMVNEQTYTFTDRGDREVTLRPEMTPSVARMVAGKRRELAFPLRWYSIPSLYRYERPQRGRLREHWQLNCDMFGSDDISADVEIITLGYQTMIDFGATPAMFEIQLNNRAKMISLYKGIGIEDENTITAIIRLNDRKKKISATEYLEALVELVKDEALATEAVTIVENINDSDEVLEGLKKIGIDNVKIKISSLKFRIISRTGIKLNNCELQKLNLVDYPWIKENSWKPINRKLYSVDFKDLYFIYKIKENHYIRYKVHITITSI